MQLYFHLGKRATKNTLMDVADFKASIKTLKACNLCQQISCLTLAATKKENVLSFHKTDKERWLSCSFCDLSVKIFSFRSVNALSDVAMVNGGVATSISL